MTEECNVLVEFWGICFSTQDSSDLFLSNICYATKNITLPTDPVLQTITYKDDFVILSSNEKYYNVQKFTAYYEDMILYAGSFSRFFRWGNDDKTWSDWIELTVDNLNKYIRYVEYPIFFIEFKYVMLTDGNLVIKSVSLDWEEHNEKWKGWKPFQIAYASEKGNNKYPVRLKPFSYNPYKQNPSIKLQKDLSFILNNLHGHEIVYFRSIPDIRTKDVIYNEYSLSNVDQPKCIKVLVPNNEFPDNKLNFGPYGVDFEIPFEIHIDKRYFEWVFGNAQNPGKRDIIYFELSDRIYEVISTQLVRDFMQEPIYYKLSLIKYQIKSSRIESNDIKEKISEFTTGFDELFNEEIKSEILQVSNPQQTIEKTTVYDPIREWTYPIDCIIQHTIDNYGTSIAEYHYDLGYLYDQVKTYTTAIRYKTLANLSQNQNLTYTAWFQEEQKKTTFRNIIKVVSVLNNDITVKFDNLPIIEKDQWFGITSSNNSNFELFGQVIKINTRESEKTVTFRAPNYILTQANAAFTNWQTDTGLLGKEIFRRNFLFGFDDFQQKGIRIDSFNSKYFRISLNSSRYWFNVPRLEKDTWYGIVINISKLYQQLSLSIYTIPDKSKQTTKLDSYYSICMNGIADASFELDSYYEILMSNLRLTNIRLMNERLEPEKQSLFLNMNVIRDAHLALIIDNAIPRSRLPYIGNVQ